MGDIGRFRRSAGGAAVALLATMGWGCYPGEINSVGEADLVITARDTTYTFAPGTYVMPDSIVRIDDDGGEDDIDRSYDAAILAQIAGQFNAMGYTRITDPNAPTAPEFVVLVGATSSTYSVWYPGGGWWGWWGWYPGWGGWYPGWGGGYYPGYPWYPPVYAGSYSTGSLFVAMLEPSATIGEGGIWGGIVNGLLSSSNATTAARVTDLVDQMFDQSPYLAGN